LPGGDRGGAIAPGVRAAATRTIALCLWPAGGRPVIVKA
jgi:hypothetical protein